MEIRKRQISGAIYRSHFGGFPFPVLRIVLYNTERINPEISDIELECYGGGVLKSFWEIIEGYDIEVAFEICFVSFDCLGLSPAMAQCDVIFSIQV
jgi:hypothetical protein